VSPQAEQKIHAIISAHDAPRKSTAHA
jgi:hypothetical protein